MPLLFLLQVVSTPPATLGIAPSLDPTILAAAIVTVIAAIGGVVVQIINAMSASKDRRESAAERQALLDRTSTLTVAAKDNAVKADQLIEKTGEIHSMTNSTNANLQKALEVAAMEISGLKQLMAQMIKAAETAATAKVATDLQSALLTTVHNPRPPDPKEPA